MDYLFFDIESTGLSTDNDRIVQLAITVVAQDGTVKLSKSKMYNPLIPITKTAEETHGISDEMVKDCPRFKDDALKLKNIFENKIIVGYNIMRFDVPMLLAEFQRYKVDVVLTNKFVDCLNIEKKLNSNTLSKTYQRYTGKKLEGAHDALADVLATVEILKHQRAEILSTIEEPYDEQAAIDGSIESMLYEMSGTNDIVDLYGKFGRDKEGYLFFKFGKQKDHRIIDEPSYASWMLSSEFPTQVKDMIRAEQTKHATKKVETHTPMNLSMGNAKSNYSFKNKQISAPDDDLPF